MGIDTGIVNIGCCLYDSSNKKILYTEQHNAELGTLWDYLKYFTQLLDKLNPKMIIFEQPHANQNVIKGKKYGIFEIITVQKLAAEYKAIPIVGLSPKTVKKQFTGNGLASKEDIQKQVIANFGLEITSTHINDAIAVACSWPVTKTEVKPRRKRRKK